MLRRITDARAPVQQIRAGQPLTGRRCVGGHTPRRSGAPCRCSEGCWEAVRPAAPRRTGPWPGRGRGRGPAPGSRPAPRPEDRCSAPCAEGPRRRAARVAASPRLKQGLAQAAPPLPRLVPAPEDVVSAGVDRGTALPLRLQERAERCEIRLAQLRRQECSPLLVQQQLQAAGRGASLRVHPAPPRRHAGGRRDGREQVLCRAWTLAFPADNPVLPPSPAPPSLALGSALLSPHSPPVSLGVARKTGLLDSLSPSLFGPCAQGFLTQFCPFGCGRSEECMQRGLRHAARIPGKSRGKMQPGTGTPGGHAPGRAAVAMPSTWSCTKHLPNRVMEFHA